MDSRGCGVSLGVAVALVAWLSAPVRAHEAGTYRDFRLGMTVAEVVQKTASSPADAKVIFERPVLIQELEWRPSTPAPTVEAPAERETVAGIVFGFYKGELYRIVVRYEPDRTEGLTDQDLVDALSAAYGPARKTSARVITSAAAQPYADTEAVLARWEDDRASINLFKGFYRSSYGLVIYSKALAPAARVAIDEGLRLDRLDAPRRQQAEDLARAETESRAHAKARAANKVAFRF